MLDMNDESATVKRDINTTPFQEETEHTSLLYTHVTPNWGVWKSKM